MIAVDGQPYSIVEDIGFNRLMKSLKPNYVLPSRKYFNTNIVPKIQERVLKKVKDIVNSSDNISFTTDIWTNNANNSYISLTGHCLSPSFDLSTVVLRVKPFPGSHTATNISETIQEVMEEFTIPSHKVHVIVRDNGANIVKGILDTSYDGLSCFLHTLQLVIHDCIFEQRLVRHSCSLQENHWPF